MLTLCQIVVTKMRTTREVLWMIFSKLFLRCAFLQVCGSQLLCGITRHTGCSYSHHSFFQWLGSEKQKEYGILEVKPELNEGSKQKWLCVLSEFLGGKQTCTRLCYSMIVRFSPYCATLMVNVVVNFSHVKQEQRSWALAKRPLAEEPPCLRFFECVVDVLTSQNLRRLLENHKLSGRVNYFAGSKWLHEQKTLLLLARRI